MCYSVTMKRRIIKILNLILTVGLTVSIIGPAAETEITAQATTISEIQNQINNTQNQINNINNKIENIKNRWAYFKDAGEINMMTIEDRVIISSKNRSETIKIDVKKVF